MTLADPGSASPSRVAQAAPGASGTPGSFRTRVRERYWEPVILPFLTQRALLMTAVYFGSELIGVRRTWHALPRVPFLDVWLRWDSFYYLLIASDGYGSFEWGTDTPFFPLYPLLTVALGAVLPKAIAALIVANGAALIAVCLLYRFSAGLAGESVARRAVRLLLVFPTSFFLTAAYTESVYLVAAIGGVVAWTERRHWLAALATIAACLARPVGAVAMTVPFVVQWLVDSRNARDFPWFVLAAPAGAGLVLLVYYLSTGDPLAFLHAPQVESLGRYSGTNALTYIAGVVWDEGWSNNLMRRLLNWAALGAVGAASVHFFRQRRLDLLLLTLLPVAIPLAFQRTFLDAASMARYALAGFPLFLALARFVPEGPRERTVETAFQMAQLVLALCFATARWAE